MEGIVKEWPLVSINTPTYNRAAKLEKCLKSIKMQTYPQDKIEIIVADDESTDHTQEVAKKYNAKIVMNTSGQIDVGRSLAFEASAGEYIIILDDDNFFVHENQLLNLVKSVLESGCVAGEMIYHYYQKNDFLMNRYCALFGIYDPSFYYMKRQDHLKQTDKSWTLKGDVLKETDLYYKVKFNEKNIPTLGCQGFIVRSDMLRKTNWKPVLSHMDVCADLVKMGADTYAMVKDEFGHDCVEKKRQLLKKLKRNINMYYDSQKERSIDYNMGLCNMIKLGLVMGTFIIPIKDAMLGYMKKPDAAWLVHPILCFQVAFLYATQTVKRKLGK